MIMEAKNYKEVQTLMRRRDFLADLRDKIKKSIADVEEIKFILPEIEVSTYNSAFAVEKKDANRPVVGEFIIAYGVIVEKEINSIDKQLDKL